MSDADPSTLEQRLRTQLYHCHGFDGDSISRDRKHALDYYFQRPRGDETTGRSAVVSGDVSAMVEATLAQMMEAFSGDRVCDFDPLGRDDETQAQLESEAVQYFVMGTENGFLELVSAIKEALLLRNGLMLVDAEDVTQRIPKRYGNVEPEALPELIGDENVVDHTYDEDTLELLVVREVESREFRSQSVSLENFLYYAEWDKPTLEGIPICAVRHVESRAELIGRGFPKDKVDSLTAYKRDYKAEKNARNPRNLSKPQTSIDKSQEEVEWYEVYVRMEAEGGADEQHRVSFSYQDTVILEDEIVPFIRLASGTAILNPHRFTGISLYDKLKQNQDMRTQLRRALYDNVNATTKNRTAGLEGVVNDDDLSDGRVNNHVRVKTSVPDVRQAIMAFQIPDTSANILANLESTARERSEMGGAALDLQTAQMQIGGDRMGSQGLEKAYSVAEQLSAGMMKTLAATLLRSVFLLAHRTLREYFDGEVPIKRDGKWTMVRPSDWPERRSVTVKPGMSPGERSRRISAQAEVINSQLVLADKGLDGVMVGLKQFNRAVMDWARLAEVQNPEQYFIDPESGEAKVALEDKNKRAQEQEQQKQALMQHAVSLEQLKIGFEKYRQDTDLQFKYFAELLGAEIEEAKIAGGATVDLLKAKRDAENANRDGQNSTREDAGEESAAAGDIEES